MAGVATAARSRAERDLRTHVTRGLKVDIEKSLRLRIRLADGRHPHHVAPVVAVRRPRVYHNQVTRFELFVLEGRHVHHPVLELSRPDADKARPERGQTREFSKQDAGQLALGHATSE